MKPRIGTTLVALASGAALLGTACDVAPESELAGAPAPDSARAPSPERWAVTPQGIGAVRAGMTLAEARGALGAELAASDGAQSCAHIAVPGAPGRVLAMVVDGRIARVEVKDSAVATDRGARVGDAEARIDSLYRGRVRAEPHKYTAGHYLVVTPEATADSAFRLIFETDGKRVTEYRAGRLPEVAWVEGCS